MPLNLLKTSFKQMIEPQAIYNGYTAMVAGLITSVHCVGMCGPLSCAFCPKKGDLTDKHVILTSYHLSKLLSYGLVGALAGILGSVVILSVESSWLNRLPWILVLFFLTLAFRLDRFFLKPKGLGGIYAKISARFTRMSKPVAAGCIGFASPLLPCGPLYMIFGLSFFSGSALRGAEFAIGFGLGTLPLLWLFQSQFFQLGRYTSPVALSVIQRSVAFIAAIVVAWRLRTTLGIEGAENWVCHPF